MIQDQFSFRMGHAVDAEALLYFQPQLSAEVMGISGSIRGPHCQFARTLQAEVPLQQLDITDNLPCLGQVLIPDPCYWSPKLPFQYDLQLCWKDQSGEEFEGKATLGLRRWACEDSDWKLEQSRIVLRGGRVAEPNLKTLEEAREAEAALIVEMVGAELLQAASSLGVPLIVNGGAAGLNLEATVRRLSWSSAVLAILIDLKQHPLPMDWIGRPSQPFVGGVIDAKTDLESTRLEGIDFLAVRIRPGERPPEWMHKSNKPVVAIREEVSDGSLVDARRECDRLQAELAPEFDLAGYFIAP